MCVIMTSPVKAVVLGEAGVGKSTIVSLLQGKETGGKRIPTIGVNVERLLLDDGEKQVAVWDLAGQTRFQFMWEDFMRGSSLTVLVTDSSEKNVAETKQILDRYQSRMGSEIIAIANKQDLAGRMTPAQIAQYLGVPTYGMVAIDDTNQDALLDIIDKRIQ
jgi:small GTP-binding protein